MTRRFIYIFYILMQISLARQVICCQFCSFYSASASFHCYFFFHFAETVSIFIAIVLPLFCKHMHPPCISHLAHCAHHLKGNPGPGETGRGFTTSLKMDSVLLMVSCQKRLLVVWHFYRAFHKWFLEEACKKYHNHGDNGG